MMNENSQRLLENSDLCRDLLYRMMLVNTFENTALRLFGQGLIHGTLHLCIGEEAACVGTCAALKKEDYMLATHRGHGQAIGKGVDINAMMAELLARDTGTNRGRGGSMHICDHDSGVLGANGILGANGPIACGAALTIRMKKIPDRVVACFFGDGAANEGAMHEAMNLASVWQLPVLFILTNNTYGMSMPLHKAVKEQDLTLRAVPFGMKAIRCDGNDVLSVYAAVAEARAYALENGPVLIVEDTYRTCGHSKSDRNRYRTREEIQYWSDRSPILRFRERLTQAGVFSPEALDALALQAEQAVEAAVEYAKSQPQPDCAQPELGVYAQGREWEQ